MAELYQGKFSGEEIDSRLDNVKRTCRFVIGTSTAGWTEADCDYLCDGEADDVEINAAIQALPETGGEIIILDGTYNITNIITIDKDNVILNGNGASTILLRKSDILKIINLLSVKKCVVQNLNINGNNRNYTSNNYGIEISGSGNNTITGNNCNNNRNGIDISNSGNNTITGNNCNNNNNDGISVSGSDNNTITGNNCGSNDDGISVSGSDNNTITGNNCNNNESRGISVSGSNNTITGNNCNNNNNGISINNSDNNTITGNNCGSNSNLGIYLYYTNNSTITGNNCNNNRRGIYILNSNNNAITGNTFIRGTGQTSDYDSSQYTIDVTDSSFNLFVGNNIMGKNYVDEGTDNTWANNKYN